MVSTPLGRGLDAAVGKGIPVDAVPAQAVAHHVLVVLRPQAAGVLVSQGGGAALLIEHRVGTPHLPAEGGQVGGGGVDAAGAVDAHRLVGQGTGVLSGEVGFGQQALVKILAGEPGVVQPGGLQNGLADIGVKVLAADRLHHQLRQGEAVVAVDAEGAGVGLQRLTGELLQQGVRRQGVRIVQQEAVGGGGAGQAGGVVQQHPHGDVLIPRVRHGEIGQIGGHRGVQIDVPLLRQVEHGGGGVHLAYDSSIGKSSTFTMTGGSIIGCAAKKRRRCVCLPRGAHSPWVPALRSATATHNPGVAV